MSEQSKKKLYFTVIFATVGLIAMQVPLNQLIGSKANFTLFDTFGPISAAFLDTPPGLVMIGAVQFFNLLIHGAQVLDAATVIRFFPTLFAAFYFAKNSKLNVVVPLLAMAAFILHPVGRSAWYYSLYWLLPVFCHFLRDKSLFAKSLGATFTAHAVGGAAWVWVFGLSKTVWTALIPIVTFERLVFALGIAFMYMAVNNLLSALMSYKIIRFQIPIDRKYVLRFGKNL